MHFGKVDAIVCDIDGCLSRGKGSALDLPPLLWLRDYDDQVDRDGGVPISLCTGRPLAYVEAFTQMLAVRRPCICENGAIIYDPVQDRFHHHPAITPTVRGKIAALRRTILTEQVSTIAFVEEAGKEVCISLGPVRPEDGSPLGRDIIVDLFEDIRRVVDDSVFFVTHSTTAVDITPKGIDKGAGLAWLSDLLGVPEARMLGIGDTAGDLPFLTRAGLSAAPANASAAVKSVVSYVSPHPYAEGVVDIVRTCCQSR